MKNICNYCQPLNVGNFGLLVVTVHQLALCDCDKELRQASYKEGRFVLAQGCLCWPLLSRLHSMEHPAAHHGRRMHWAACSPHS